MTSSPLLTGPGTHRWTRIVVVGLALASLGLDLLFSWLVAGLASAAGPAGQEMALRLVWAPALPFLATLALLAVAALADRAWSPVVLAVGGAWVAWTGLSALVTMGGHPGADLLGAVSFSLAVTEIGLAVAAALHAWARTSRA